MLLLRWWWWCCLSVAGRALGLLMMCRLEAETGGRAGGGVACVCLTETNEGPQARQQEQCLVKPVLVVVWSVG